MDEQRKIAWTQAFAAMCMVWHWLEPTVFRIQVWDGALEDISPEEIKHGVAYVIAHHTGSPTPTPGDVRDAVKKMRVAKAAGDRGAPLGVLKSADPKLKKLVEHVSSKLSLPRPD